MLDKKNFSDISIREYPCEGHCKRKSKIHVCENGHDCRNSVRIPSGTIEAILDQRRNEDLN